MWRISKCLISPPEGMGGTDSLKSSVLQATYDEEENTLWRRNWIPQNYTKCPKPLTSPFLSHFYSVPSSNVDSFFNWTKISKWVGTFPIHEQCIYKRWGPTVNLPCFLPLCIYLTDYYDLEFESYFIKKKFFFTLTNFFKFILNLLWYCFSFMLSFLVARHVGSYLPSQGSNLHPLHWKAV